ncbi:MAG: cryptochrome/photolyase family protein [Leptonema sp. (in: bacteria)]
MEISIFWFRRDLRIHDNPALYYSLKQNKNVVPIFIFDVEILKFLPKDDKRVNLIFDVIKNLKIFLESKNSSFIILYGNPKILHQKLIETFPVKNLYFNLDFEPYPIQRDEQVKNIYKSKNLQVNCYLDHILFRPDEILKQDQTPYCVYSQYKKQWLKEFAKKEIKNYPSEDWIHNFIQREDIKNYKEIWLNFFKENQNIYETLETLEEGRFPNPLLEKIKFIKTPYILKPLNKDADLIKNYKDTRDFPYLEKGTTNSSVYLRFGLESLRKILQYAKEYSSKLLEELIWREFYIMILYHFPDSINTEWNQKYSYLRELWEDIEKKEESKKLFERWKEGKTGYPLVDAGMRELSETGYMHNRVRMVCASFLVKNLMIDWRYGERYFALKLMDFELASNVGNWQWVSGTGVDASPYFRIFNPILQQKKFDPEFQYCKKWIKEFNTLDYPTPIINLENSKEKILRLFKKKI